MSSDAVVESSQTLFRGCLRWWAALKERERPTPPPLPGQSSNQPAGEASLALSRWSIRYAYYAVGIVVTQWDPFMISFTDHVQQFLYLLLFRLEPPLCTHLGVLLLRRGWFSFRTELVVLKIYFTGRTNATVIRDGPLSWSLGRWPRRRLERMSDWLNWKGRRRKRMDRRRRRW